MTTVTVGLRWQNEKDIIIAINDVPVRGKDGSALADLIHDGKRWYSGLPGISTLTVRGAGQTRLQVGASVLQSPLFTLLSASDYVVHRQTIVVNHLESDIKEEQQVPALQRKQSNGVDLIKPRPSPSDTVASDSAGTSAAPPLAPCRPCVHAPAGRHQCA